MDFQYSVELLTNEFQYNIDLIITEFNKFLNSKVIGHMNKDSMVYIIEGNYIECNINYDGDKVIFKQIAGNVHVCNKFLKKLKHYCNPLLRDRPYINLERCDSIQNYDETCDVYERHFLTKLMYLDKYIFTNNNVDDLTDLSRFLDSVLKREEFANMYIEKYSEIMYDKIEQYTRFIKDSKVISILNLIQIIHSNIPNDKYISLVYKYKDIPGDNNMYKYIRQISSSM